MKNLGFYIVLLGLVACQGKLSKPEARKVGTSDCRSVPAFVRNTPINPKKVAFSTSQNRQKGVTLIEYGTTKTWKHPSYDTYGYFGQIATAKNGRIFLAPVPIINVASEPESGYNSVYSIDPATGVLAPFLQLSKKKIYDPNNPFGVMGISYDCYGDLLYVTSVYLSDKEHERGALYCIDVATRKILDTYEGVDGFGCYALGTTNERRLYFGSTRTSSVYSIGLDEDGRFIGKHREEFTIDMLGPRGDDKVKKISFSNNQLKVTGYEFMNTLIAPTNVQETIYLFTYDKADENWEQIQY